MKSVDGQKMRDGGHKADLCSSRRPRTGQGATSLPRGNIRYRPGRAFSPAGGDEVVVPSMTFKQQPSASASTFGLCDQPPHTTIDDTQWLCSPRTPSRRRSPTTSSSELLQVYLGRPAHTSAASTPTRTTAAPSSPLPARTLASSLATRVSRRDTAFRLVMRARCTSCE